jgi:hypothetical protein
MNEHREWPGRHAWDDAAHHPSFITVVSMRHGTGYGSDMTTTPQDPDTIEPDVVPSSDPDPISTPGENPDLPDTEPQPVMP